MFHRYFWVKKHIENKFFGKKSSIVFPATLVAEFLGRIDKASSIKTDTSFFLSNVGRDVTFVCPLT